MKRGSIFIVTLLMLLGVIVLLLLIGKLGINGYASYDGKFDNLAMKKGVTGNSVLSWFEKLFGIQTSPAQIGNSYFDDYTDNITLNSGINQSSIVDVEWDGGSAYKPVSLDGEINPLNENGLLLLYHFNNDSFFGENDTFIFDFSGKGFNGVVGGNAQPTNNGKYFGGFYFDGANDYISGAGNPIGNRSTYDITISAWISITNILGTKSIYGEKISIADTNNLNNYFSTGGSSLSFDRYPPGGGAFGTSGGLSANNLTHVAYVENTTTRLLYINGVLKATSTTLETYTGQATSIFVIGDYANNDFNGTIDELAIWNRSLTSQEIQQLYGQGPPTGSFKSNNINLGGEFNALKGEWSESNNGVTSIQISKDGSNWCALSNGGQITEVTCNQLPTSSLIYRASFNDATDLDWINLTWSNVLCEDLDGDDYSTLGGGTCCADGQCSLGVDCQDGVFEVNPGAIEICGDGIDNDCVGGDLACVAPNTIYVDNQLTNDCNGDYSIAGRNCGGSDGLAFNTLQEAANNVSAGDIVLVRGGTYNEQVQVTRSGTATQRITFKNYATEHPVIDAEYIRDHCIFVGKFQSPGGGNFVTIDGLVCKNPISLTGSSAGILVYGTKNVTIRNNVVLGKIDENGFSYLNNARGIFVQGPNEDTIIEYNYVQNAGNGAINSRAAVGDFSGVPQRPIFRYNHIGHCKIFCDPTASNFQTCLDQGQNNNFAMPLSGGTEFALVEHNVAHHCDDGGFGNDDSGTHIFRDNIQYRSNAFYSSSGNGPGIKMKPSGSLTAPSYHRGNNTVNNNIAFMNWASGFEINSWVGTGIGSRVYNNIAWWNGITGLTSSGAEAERPEQHNLFKNNLALNNSRRLFNELDVAYTNANEDENDYNYAGDGRALGSNSVNNIGPQFKGISLLMTDNNGDGIGNACDICNDNGLDIDHLNDVDGDGVCGNVDVCPMKYDPLQNDVDGDGIGNACDIDNSADVDGDGVKDNVDNCVDMSNPLHTIPTDCNGDGDTIDRDEVVGAQCDGDRDKVGDVCDTCPLDYLNDADGDSVCGNVDNCQYVHNPGQEDSDGDGIGDACDSDNLLDADGDGVLDNLDNCPYIFNPGQEDTDADGTPDILDPLDDPFAYPSVFPDPYNVSTHILYAQQQMKNVFSLNSSSPLIDAGKVISGYHCLTPGPRQPTDGPACVEYYDGNGDGVAAPDIGAYEYNPGTTGCITLPELNIEIQKFVDGQIGIIEASNKVISYLGC